MTYRFASEGAGRDAADFASAVVDASRYHDPVRFDEERRKALSRSWLLAGHASELPRGHHLVWEGFGQSVVLTRDDDGALRGFHNVCQHRGTRLVASSGWEDAGRFACPWHGWTYDREGRVVSVPRRALFDPTTIADLRAPAVAAEEQCGFIWVNLAGTDAPPLLEHLAELGPELNGYEMGAWTLVGAQSWPIDVNWKAVVDGFSEDYHARDTHRATIPEGLLFEDTRWTLYSTHSMMVTPFARVDYDGLPSPIDHRFAAYCHYTVFPTSVFSCFPTHAQVMSIVPIDVERTELRVWVVGRVGEDPDGTVRASLERGFQHFCAIAAEDVGALAELAANRRSLSHTANVFGLAEQRLVLFHRVLDAQLAGTDP